LQVDGAVGSTATRPKPVPCKCLPCCQRPPSLLFVLPQRPFPPADSLVSRRDARDPESHRPYATHWRCAEPARTRRGKAYRRWATESSIRATARDTDERRGGSSEREHGAFGGLGGRASHGSRVRAYLLWSRRESAALSTGRHRACARDQANKQTKLVSSATLLRSWPHDERRRACYERRTWHSCIRRCRSGGGTATGRACTNCDLTRYIKSAGVSSEAYSTSFSSDCTPFRQSASTSPQHLRTQAATSATAVSSH
jgi:hypothetical protein